MAGAREGMVVRRGIHLERSRAQVPAPSAGRLGDRGLRPESANTRVAEEPRRARQRSRGLAARDRVAAHRAHAARGRRRERGRDRAPRAPGVRSAPRSSEERRPPPRSAPGAYPPGWRSPPARHRRRPRPGSPPRGRWRRRRGRPARPRVEIVAGPSNPASRPSARAIEPPICPRPRIASDYVARHGRPACRGGEIGP